MISKLFFPIFETKDTWTDYSAEETLLNNSIHCSNKGLNGFGKDL